jgi:hypothetical protein
MNSQPGRASSRPASRTTAAAASRLWSAEETSVFLGVPVVTLYQWRHRRIGPTLQSWTPSAI